MVADMGGGEGKEEVGKEEEDDMIFLPRIQSIHHFHRTPPAAQWFSFLGHANDNLLPPPSPSPSLPSSSSSQRHSHPLRPSFLLSLSVKPLSPPVPILVISRALSASPPPLAASSEAADRVEASRCSPAANVKPVAIEIDRGCNTLR